jgi:hypothetical protein
MEKRSRFKMTEEHLNFIRKAIEKEKDLLDLNDIKYKINLKKKIFIIFANEYSDYCDCENQNLFLHDNSCFKRFSKMMDNNFFSNNPINSEKLFKIIFEFLRTDHGNVQKNTTIKTQPLMYLTFKDLATKYNKEEKNIITSKQIQNFLLTLHINNKNKIKDEYKIFMKKLLELNNEKTEIKEKECREELLKIIGNQKKEIIYDDDVGEEELDVVDEELDVGEEETYNSPSKLKGDIPESPASLWNFFSPTTHKTPPHPDSKDSIGTFTLPSDTSPSDLKPVRSSKLLTFSPKNNKRQRDKPPVSEPPSYKRQRTSDGKRKKSSRKKSSRKKSSRKKSSRKRTICKK